jgi:hypothetical protein
VTTTPWWILPEAASRGWGTYGGLGGQLARRPALTIEVVLDGGKQTMADYEIFEFEQVVFQCGLTLPQAKLAYKTYGELNAARDNVIVMPTFYGAQHTENEALMAAWPTLDPKKYFRTSEGIAVAFIRRS